MRKTSKIGMTFGIYTVIGETEERSSDGHRILLIRCSVCNRVFKMASNRHLNEPRVRCPHGKSLTHGMKNKRLKHIFRGMIDRCYSKKCKVYHVYGERGIYICDEWLNEPKKFEEWSLKNGYADDLTINRKDSSGPYAPWNCEWITASNNSKFKSSTITYTINGITDSGKGWARRLHLGENRINVYYREFGYDFTKKFIEDTYNGFIVLLPRNQRKK